MLAMTEKDPRQAAQVLNACSTDKASEILENVVLSDPVKAGKLTEVRKRTQSRGSNSCHIYTHLYHMPPCNFDAF